MEENEKIHCYHCGREVDYNKKICPECASPLHVNDRLGIIRHAISHIEAKAKGTVYKKIYTFTWQYFLGKLLSFLVASTVILSGVRTAQNITAQIDNNKYLNNDKTVIKEDVQIYEYSVTNVNITQDEIVETNNESQEIISEENNENVEEIIEENNVNDEPIIEVNGVEIYGNSWNTFVNGYIKYIRGGTTGEGVFAGAPLTDGALYRKIVSEEIFASNGESPKDKDLCTFFEEDESKTHIYAYFHFADEPYTFAKLTFLKNDNLYLLESDEEYATSVEALYE